MKKYTATGPVDGNVFHTIDMPNSMLWFSKSPRICQAFYFQWIQFPYYEFPNLFPIFSQWYWVITNTCSGKTIFYLSEQSWHVYLKRGRTLLFPGDWIYLETNYVPIFHYWTLSNISNKTPSTWKLICQKRLCVRACLIEFLRRESTEKSASCLDLSIHLDRSRR